MPFLRPRKAAVYAYIAMLATQVFSVAEAQRPSREPSEHPTGIRDIALAAGGTLRGKVINVQGNGLPHTTVTISQQGYVAETRSDARGEFRLGGLGGGLYIVDADGWQQAHRVWAPGTAPPCATDELLIVGGSNIVRGQLRSHSKRRWLIENAGQIALITTFIALPIVYATKPYGS